MTNPFETLNLLANMLPDPDGELFPRIEKLDSFTPFPRLPIEVRTIIWKLCVPRGRTVQIEVNKSGSFKGSHAPAPAVLQICQESRYECLKMFSVLIENKKRQPIYFQPNIDTIFLHGKPNDAYDFLEWHHVSSEKNFDDCKAIKKILLKRMTYLEIMFWLLRTSDFHALQPSSTPRPKGKYSYLDTLEELTILNVVPGPGREHLHQFGFLGLQPLLVQFQCPIEALDIKHLIVEVQGVKVQVRGGKVKRR